MAHLANRLQLFFFCLYFLFYNCLSLLDLSFFLCGQKLKLICVCVCVCACVKKQKKKMQLTVQARSSLSQSSCWARSFLEKIFFNGTESTFAFANWIGDSVCALHTGQQSPAEILPFYPDASFSVALNGGSRCLKKQLKTLEHTTSPRAPTRCSFIWQLFLLLCLFPIYSRASLLLWHPPTHTHSHTGAQTLKMKGEE